MTIFLVDSNFLGNPKLVGYLGQSTSNKIVIPEQIMVELQKVDPVHEIVTRLSCVRQFSKQVLVGRSLPLCYRRAIKTGLQAKGLIDYPQSKHFATWYDDVKSGGPAVMRHLAARKQESEGVITHLAENAHEILPALRMIKTRFNPAELKEIRNGQLTNMGTQRKLVQAAFDITKGLFSQLGGKDLMPSSNQVVHYYLFRYSLCMIALFIKFAKTGGLPENTGALVNTIIDLHIAAEATYFHGILSEDKQVIDAYSKSRQIVRAMRGYLATFS